MIISKLTGGIGNQLFQYALGRNLSLKNSTNLVLDITEYTYEKDRRYSLFPFNINATTMIRKSAINSSRPYYRIKNMVDNYMQPKSIVVNHIKVKCVNEKFPDFNSKVLESGDNIYLKGFWQSEKYFKEIEEILRKDLTLKKKKKHMQGIYLEIKRTKSVSIHFRRGDYIHDKYVSRSHGICGLDYYREALKILAQKVKDPHLFIFSDDISWVKSNLISPYPVTYVSQYLKNDYEEMMLMSECSYHILANSSFSWWGAWLNSNKDKVIISPKKWFKDKLKSTRDLIPESWLRI